MTEALTPAGDERSEPLVTDKMVARVVSDSLKWIGFRPAAPIDRARPEFTLDQLKEALFVRGAARALSFTTLGSREELRMWVTAVRELEDTEGYALEKLTGVGLGRHLFPRDRYETAQQWIVEGPLEVPRYREGVVEDYSIVVAAAYDDPDLRNDESHDPRGIRVPDPPADYWLRALAVVSSDCHGRLEGAVLQRLPAPADQLLEIPPP